MAYTRYSSLPSLVASLGIGSAMMISGMRIRDGMDYGYESAAGKSIRGRMSGGGCPGEDVWGMSGGCQKGDVWGRMSGLGCFEMSWDDADWFISFYIHTPHSKLGRTNVPHYKVRLYVSNKSMKIN